MIEACHWSASGVPADCVALLLWCLFERLCGCNSGVFDSFPPGLRRLSLFIINRLYCICGRNTRLWRQKLLQTKMGWITLSGSSGSKNTPFSARQQARSDLPLSGHTLQLCWCRFTDLRVFSELLTSKYTTVSDVSVVRGRGRAVWDLRKSWELTSRAGRALSHKSDGQL